jgi:hypothetical protein
MGQINHRVATDAETLMPATVAASNSAASTNIANATTPLAAELTGASTKSDSRSTGAFRDDERAFPAAQHRALFAGRNGAGYKTNPRTHPRGIENREQRLEGCASCLL